MRRLIVPIYSTSSILDADGAVQESGNHFLIDRTEVLIV